MQSLKSLQRKVLAIGYSPKLHEPEKKRLLVFNQLNFFALILMLARCIYIAIHTPGHYTFATLLINFLLPLLFACMMWVMHQQFFKAATICSFILAPPLFALVSWATKDDGMYLLIMLYMLFSFYFLNRLKNIVVAFLYCLAFFLLIHFKLEKEIGSSIAGTANFYLVISNYLVAFSLFFATLYLIKNQVRAYEKSVSEKNKILAERNIEIEAKNDTLIMQAEHLENKTIELTALNQVKTKLFSVVSHDLRTSIYSLKNIFDALRLGNTSNEQVLKQLPDLSIEIDNCTELMDNLLSWGRDQFKENKVNVNIDFTDLHKIAGITCKHLMNRAVKKNIALVNCIAAPTNAYADKEMMKIVLRNLIANAIKFTPPGGKVEIFSQTDSDCIRIIVKDNGVGMAAGAIARVFNNEYYTTPGTNKEIGTGLGLIICRDFIESNNGHFAISSKVNEGTSVVISLPNEDQNN
jgi:two-component system, sensor histidine kinase and response regulator